MDNLLSKALLLFITASILLPLSSRACLLGTITYRGWIGINKSITSKTIIHVPQDYQSIQKAIDHATPGTTIVIDSGIYYEAVHIADKQDITMGLLVKKLRVPYQIKRGAYFRGI